MSDLSIKLRYAEIVADWFIALAEEHSRKGGLNDALACANVAAGILARHNRVLSSDRLESLLNDIAEHLPDNLEPCPADPTGRRTPTFLHILSEALAAGGVTQGANRWMIRERNNGIHHAVLLAQNSPIPDEFSQTVREGGGKIFLPDKQSSLVQQALWLRKIARDHASYIVLHITYADVVCGAAFGIDGGPPILLMNHTAHTFWTGAAIADVVANLRGSALERHWTQHHRGVEACATVPIPLPIPSHGASKTRSIKAVAKRRLDVPEDAIVILTVGANFKYLPLSVMDFLATFEDILCQVLNAYLIAVGVEADRRWRRASERVTGRIRALGVLSQQEIALIHEATDIYAEGFPFGTTTALLEAGIKGIPVVLSPAECPPPFGSDGIALDDVVERSPDMEAYKSSVVALCRDPVRRATLGDRVAKSIADHHTGSGWHRYCRDAIDSLPCQHRVRRSIKVEPTFDSVHTIWAAFVSAWHAPLEETFEDAVVRSLSLGVRPVMVDDFTRQFRFYRNSGVSRGIPITISLLFCNVVSPLLPIWWAKMGFRSLAFVCRPSLLQRFRRKFYSLIGWQRDPRSWYEEYRIVRKQRESGPITVAGKQNFSSTFRAAASTERKCLRSRS
jgi:hypothetical protein